MEGVLAVKTDNSTQLVLDGLTRALAAPAGSPLHGGKSEPALFANTVAARRAAQQCKMAGWLETVRSEMNGKFAREICTITEQGIAYLLDQVSPKPILEEFVRAVETCGKQIAEALATAQRGQSALEALDGRLVTVLKRIPEPTLSPTLPSANGSDPWKSAALAFLAEWSRTRPNDDCPLPELYRHVKRSAPHLTIGQLHDGLRQLHDNGTIYLHPWTGPLSEIPEPAIALLVGHMIAYYASQREMNNEQ
jgi:hypothetical protein